MKGILILLKISCWKLHFVDIQRHGAEVVDGVGEVAAEGAAVLSSAIVGKRVVELAAALAAEGVFLLAVVRTFVLVLQL